MNLSHLPPILFAQEVQFRNEKEAKVKCFFPSPPTLPMLIEAAAQSSAALNNQDLPLMGFLTMCKDVYMHKKASLPTCIIHIKESFSVGEISEFSFQALASENELLATGSLTIVVPSV